MTGYSEVIFILHAGDSRELRPSGPLIIRALCQQIVVVGQFEIHFKLTRYHNRSSESIQMAFSGPSMARN